MRVLLIFIIGVCFATAGTVTEKNGNFMKGAEVTLSGLLETLRAVMKQGFPDAGIPVLDPYQFDCTHIDFENYMFRILGNITDGFFAGLGDFQVREFNFSVEKAKCLIDFNFYFPSLNFTSKYYEIKGSIVEMFPLSVEGVARLEVYDLNIWSKIYFQVCDDGSGVHVDRFENPGFTVSQIISKTEYDDNIDGIANAMVQELLADYLNRFNKYLAATYSPFIIDALNELLSEKSSVVL